MGVNLPNSIRGSAGNRYGWAGPYAPLSVTNLGIQSFWCVTPPGGHFINMLADPDYQAIAPIRAAAPEDSRLVETEQLKGLA